MSITQVAPATLAPQASTGAGTTTPQNSATQGATAAPPTPADAAGSNASKSASGSSSAGPAKSDNDAVKVSISDSAAKLLAANKKVNPDGTVGPHHKPRHPNAPTKPVA